MNDHEFTVNSQGTEYLALIIVSHPAIIHLSSYSVLSVSVRGEKKYILVTMVCKRR